MRRVSHHGAAARRLALRLHPSRAAVCATLRMRRAAGVCRASVAQTSLEYQTAKAPPALLFGRRGRALGSRSVALFVLHIACMRYARARGTPGSQPARGPVRHAKLATRDCSHHGKPFASAFRARCVRLALRQPRRTDALARAANLVSSAGDPRPVGRIIAAWASAGARCVTSRACGHRTPPRARNARDAPLDWDRVIGI